MRSKRHEGAPRWVLVFMAVAGPPSRLPRAAAMRALGACGAHLPPLQPRRALWVNRAQQRARGR